MIEKSKKKYSHPNKFFCCQQREDLFRMGRPLDELIVWQIAWLTYPKETKIKYDFCPFCYTIGSVEIIRA